MVATLVLVAKDKGGPELECQILLWPAADSSFTAKSYQEYADCYPRIDHGVELSRHGSDLTVWRRDRVNDLS